MTCSEWKMTANTGLDPEPLGRRSVHRLNIPLWQNVQIINWDSLSIREENGTRMAASQSLA